MSRAIVARRAATTLARYRIPRYFLNPYARAALSVGRAAVNTGMPYVKKWAARRIQRAWKGRRGRKGGLMRPNKRQKRAFAMRPDPPARTKNFVSGTVLFSSVLDQLDITQTIQKGAAAGDRRYNYVDVTGLRIQFVVQNNSPFIYKVFHIAVVQQKWTNAQDNALTQNFYTAPGGPNEGYNAIDFDDATVPKAFKGTLPLYKGKWNVMMHKRILVSPINQAEERPGNKRGATGCAALKYWIPIKQRLHFDSSSGPAELVNKPIYILVWQTPQNINDESDIEAMTFHESHKIYFKQQ